MLRHTAIPTSKAQPASERALGLRDKIAEYISRQIAIGAWVQGERVPSESELMAMFGASRMTVHTAVRELTARGLLRRHKGLGTFVAEPRPYVAIYEHLDIVEEIEKRGLRHSARVIQQALRPASAEEAEDFGIRKGKALFRAVVLHRANETPVELEDRLINPEILPNCMEIDLEKRSLFSLLLRSHPYREGNEVVRAILPKEKDRALMGAVGNKPCLEIVRRTWSPKGVVTQARLLRIGENAVMHGRIIITPPDFEKQSR